MLYDDKITDHLVAVSVITGFLGSGKTTLLNYLLQHPEIEETAVLINEFGEVGLDHLLVTELSEGVLLLSSGCICCTIQGELVESLKGLYMKRLAGQVPEFKRIIIETTGLADPIPIVTCLMKDPLFRHSYRLESLVTTVDAVHGEGQLNAHQEAVKQAAVADRIIITKTDLADQSTVQSLRSRLTRLNPAAAIIPAQFGQVPPNRLFDVGLYDPKTKTIEVQRWLNEEAYHPVPFGEHQHGGVAQGGGRSGDHVQGGIDVNRHDDNIMSFCTYLYRPVDWQAFLDWYEDLANNLGDHLLRVKGIVNVAGEDEPYVIHCVQATRHTPTKLPAWPDDDRRSRIVFITQDLPASLIEDTLQAVVAPEEVDRVEGAGDGSASPVVTEKAARMGRKRWLNDGEISRIFGALVSYAGQPAVNAIRLILLTGARSREVLQAQWNQFDLDRATWQKSSDGGFQGQPRRVRLSEPALALLRRMRTCDTEGTFLFPGESPGRPLQKLTPIWMEVTEAAAIEDAPLEALQPTLSSRLFRDLDQEAINRLLGIVG